MAQGNKPTRKERVYRRRDGQERGRAAAADADQRRLAALPHELAVAQLDAIPEEDRSSDWQAQRDRAQHDYDQAHAQARALDKHAEKLLGAPLSSEERRSRRAALRQARRDTLEHQLEAWEDTMAAHERNLDALEAVPESARGEWRGDVRATPVFDRQGGEMSWQEAWDANETALDTYERAIGAASALVEAEA